MKYLLILLATSLTLACSAPQKSNSAKVFFVSPKDGQTVSNPIKVNFAVDGMMVRPAGKLIDGAGHHHLLVDVDMVDEGKHVPATSGYTHYGKGQTKDSITLPKGTHTLTLQFADGAHKSYGPRLRSSIKITVK